MEFPIELRNAIEKQVTGYQHSQLKKMAQDLSDRYRKESGRGKKLLTQDMEAAVYAIVRMPATFGAVSDTIQYVRELYQGEITSLLDAGAGTGAATWAAAKQLPLEAVTCLEREGAMRRSGETFMKEGPPVLRNAHWMNADLTKVKLEVKADLVLTSYVLNEMTEKDREVVLKNLWEAANKMLLIIEPGTPSGFLVLKKARKMLLDWGAHITAPCPHEEACRLVADDWCHFTCRVQRSKQHKLLKDGDVPYEDEKYAYMAFVKEKADHVQSRILRHPYIDKGRVYLEICGRNENKAVYIRKKDGMLFKQARKAKCGDGIDFG